MGDYLCLFMCIYAYKKSSNCLSIGFYVNCYYGYCYYVMIFYAYC